MRTTKFRGRIFYLKPSLRRGLSSDLIGYCAAHPAFPHEPTADQFFDEAQFEAYRELGYRTAEGLIEQLESLTGNKESICDAIDDAIAA
jgi:hypothetical protein